MACLPTKLVGYSYLICVLVCVCVCVCMLCVSMCSVNMFCLHLYTCTLAPIPFQLAVHFLFVRVRILCVYIWQHLFWDLPIQPVVDCYSYFANVHAHVISHAARHTFMSNQVFTCQIKFWHVKSSFHMYRICTYAQPICTHTNIHRKEVPSAWISAIHAFRLDLEYIHIICLFMAHTNTHAHTDTFACMTTFFRRKHAQAYTYMVMKTRATDTPFF